MRRLAVAGLGLHAAMPLLFLVGRADAGGAYLALQVAAALAGGAAAWGLHRGGGRGLALLAAGLGYSALNRILHVVLDLTRMPVGFSVALFAGYAAAAVFAATWAARPDDASRAHGVMLAAWLLAGALALVTIRATLFGALAAGFGLLLGSTGMFLVAPNLQPDDGGPGDAS